MRNAKCWTLGFGLVLAGCVGEKPKLPEGAAATAMFPAPTPDNAARSYRIGPLDTIAVTVFQEPDLTVKDVPVDASGSVILPLIGELHAADLTTAQLSAEIARRLQSRYLENPQVSVLVETSVSQKVTVEGSVTEPGVYEIKGRTTLLDALAMAKGTSRVAALDQVVIFREINGQTQGALFSAKKITLGQQPDPEILGNDTVVVGLSNIKAAWRDILTASPLIGAFSRY